MPIVLSVYTILRKSSTCSFVGSALNHNFVSVCKSVLIGVFSSLPLISHVENLPSSVVVYKPPKNSSSMLVFFLMMIFFFGSIEIVLMCSNP